MPVFSSSSLRFAKGTLAARGDAARARARRLRVLGVRAAELAHDAREHAVKVQSVVEAVLRQVDEVGSRDGHLLFLDFSPKGAFAGLEDGGGVWRT